MQKKSETSLEDEIFTGFFIISVLWVSDFTKAFQVCQLKAKYMDTGPMFFVSFELPEKRFTQSLF